MFMAELDFGIMPRRPVAEDGTTAPVSMKRQNRQGKLEVT